MFDTLDTSGDGRIDIAELEEGVRNSELSTVCPVTFFFDFEARVFTDEEIESIYTSATGIGTLSFDERIQIEGPFFSIRQLFAELDSDDNNKCDLNELKVGLKRVFDKMIVKDDMSLQPELIVDKLKATKVTMYNEVDEQNNEDSVSSSVKVRYKYKYTHLLLSCSNIIMYVIET